jgi:hypothetical protein
MQRLSEPLALRAAENALFARWQQAHGPGSAFLPDGAMPDFSSQGFRLVFVLKEGNDPDGTWTRNEGGDLRTAWEWGYDRLKTWRRLASWAGLILEGLNFDAARPLSPESTTAILRRIACVNLKKIPGGAVAVRNEIERVAKEDAALIREQIALYAPSLIVCCGVPVFGPLQKVYDLDDSVRFGFLDEDGGKTWFFNLPEGAPVMDFWHPQMTSMTAQTLYRRLKCNLDYRGAAAVICRYDFLRPSDPSSRLETWRPRSSAIGGGALL